MSKRLTTALAAAALCGLGAAYAQTYEAAPPADNPRSMPADVTPDSPAVTPLSTESAPVITSPTYDAGTATFIRERLPSDRAAVQAETTSAMRANLIPHGELSTPEQDKGGTRALTKYERETAPYSPY